LSSFTAGDAEWFFGREALTARLLDEVDAGRRAGGGWVVVVGPSGSGKSSLIQAGAVAARPGLLVVDQLEQRLDDETFLDAIPDGVVVMGLRADFHGRALRVPRLAKALQEHQIVVGPMDPEDVRRAIVEPARRGHVDVEDGLVALLLRDYAGSLPLLSHALRATWENSRQGRLTVAGYQATGGVRDAVARSAEEVCRGLDEEQREAARHLFLRLVHADDDVRRRLPRAELRADESDGEVAERFIAARLLTVGDDSPEIAHEALIEAWPRLHAWIDNDRDSRRAHRRITEAAVRWEEADHDPDLLLRLRGHAL
jgi:energy-coupling factor transporter ATP-binding protein EcfA2